MGLCESAGPFDFENPCIRASWIALTPASFVFLLCLSALPLPNFVRRVNTEIARVTRATFADFLTLEEAEALDSSVDGMEEVSNLTSHKTLVNSATLRRTGSLVFVGLVETLFWLAFASYTFIDSSGPLWNSVLPFFVAFTWLYTVVRPLVRPVVTAPLDLFYIYFLLLFASLFQLGSIAYSHIVWDILLPPTIVLAGHILNLVAIVGLLAIVLAIPFAIPNRNVSKTEIGSTATPEDYTTLWSWITFIWIYPLIKKGRYTTLQEEDVWDLSPRLQSRPIFIRFSDIRCSSLLRRIWAANSADLIIDFFLTLLSVIFNYATPFLLKRILDEAGAEHPNQESRTKAYIYAFLTLVFSIAKSQADLQHLWIGRRAATRVRSELMAAIYDKALKRKDFSGVVDKQGQAEKQGADAAVSPGKDKKGKKHEKKKEEQTDELKAGADVGKIVNLMAVDANKIAMMLTAMYMMYGAPFEIIIAGIYLYQLLGWSAFAGVSVLLVGWPLNQYVAKRSIRIQKGLLGARDKRMGVLNELINAVKFIKFFAWEDKWIERVQDARAVELKWMTSARINSVMFYLLWMCAPVLVSIFSFFVFTALGNELTVSVAFTSIALFNMVRTPLNVIPTFIVQILQTGVSLKRISAYLDEEEVTPQVSSLKAKSTDYAVEDGLGLEKASFKWNEVEQAADHSKSTTLDSHSNLSAPSPTEGDSSVVTDGESTVDSPDSSQDHHFELRDVDILFPEGKLTVITGPTASGKTALLMALLGEMTTISGRIIMSKNISKVDENGHTHSLSYAAQTPWIRHQSIKENILFDSPYDEERYNQVIECCALKPDLDVLEDGDSTEIGARGVNLSGGQKARVALARAVYARTKYVLLDDPLSAVDSHTARFLFDRLFCGPLLASRTVILVTHHVDLVLPGAHYLVRMLDGRIDSKGTIQELRERGILDDIAIHDTVEARANEMAASPSSTEDSEDDKKLDESKKPRQLVKDEHRETGGVKWSVYNSYLKASSYYIWVILAFFVLVFQILIVGEKVWIMIWGAAYPGAETSFWFSFKSFATPEHEIPLDGHVNYHYPASQHSTGYHQGGRFGINWPDATQHPMFYVGIYAAIGLGSALANVSSVAASYTGALKASRILFRQLLVSVVRATFRFHDTTPQGRMLNRFGKDIETIDTTLAGSLQAVISSFASFVGAVLTVAFVFPYFLIPAIFIGLAYRELAIGYLNTGRDLRRMESNTRSPIFSHFGELLEGIVTVRAFSAERRFLDSLHRKIDTTTKMWYMFWMTNRWLLLNFDILGALAVFITTLFSVATLTNAGLAGLCITSAMSITSSVYWGCRFWTALELDLNSVERIIEYLDLPQESPTIIESHRAPAYWPSSANQGALVSVENMTIKYAPDLPPVLHDLSFTLKAGERVGLLGRTGSGKSTLAMSILRFVDPSEGRIVIDGIDISTIGLHDLRSRITFIPQDATLFSGTLRDNLDPFGDHEDSECLQALYSVQLIGHSSTPSGRPSAVSTPKTSRPASVILHEGVATDSHSIATTSTEVESKTTISLDTQISAGGSNFSQGQRQLIAMARALLRRSTIIILDEATSSIDFATDAKIQTTIREHFTDSLLLTVAHRLRTVIDYDRLVVLDKGRIVEFDTPWNLIQKEEGIFRNMCLKSGSFAELEAVAREKAESSST